MNKKKIFYGWIIVFAAIALVFLDGLLLYSFGVLLPSIQAKFEMTKASVNSIFAIRCIVFAFSMIVFGKLDEQLRSNKNIKHDTIRCFKGRHGLIYGGIEAHRLQEAF